MTSSRTAWAAMLTASVIVVGVLCARTSATVPFGYDEADYMYAGRQGFLANYLDRNASSFPAFVNRGFQLSRDSTLRLATSRYVRATGDIGFYRHYHGPMYAYWIAFWDKLGVHQEASYRATGLILHAVLTLGIFCLFLHVFPSLPVQGAFVAALVFGLNRTALVTATSITQHLLFEVFSCVVLFLAGQFLQTRQRRWWIACAALLGVSFATVEIAIVLMAAVMATVVAWESRNGWPAVRSIGLSGAGVVLLTLVVVWPRGVLELNALKGYFYLAYMAMYRKTFNPIGPIELWGFKIKTYPFEFVLLAIALASALVWRSKWTHPRATMVFVTYACLFLAVTCVVTLPYTAYHASLTSTLAVITGVVFGELWRRRGPIMRFVSMAMVIASLVALTTGYYRERVAVRSAPTATGMVLSHLSTRPISERTMHVPQTLVPALHYYHPEIVAIGYDDQGGSSTEPPLLPELPSDAAAEIICAESICRRFETQSIRPVSLRKNAIGYLPETGEPLYAATIDSR